MHLEDSETIYHGTRDRLQNKLSNGVTTVNWPYPVSEVNSLKLFKNVTTAVLNSFGQQIALSALTIYILLLSLRCQSFAIFLTLWGSTTMARKLTVLIMIFSALSRLCKNIDFLCKQPCRPFSVDRATGENVSNNTLPYYTCCIQIPRDATDWTNI